MNSVTLVFPHQLFQHHPAADPGRKMILIEEHLFFSQFPFHKKKIILHRASMKYYAAYLEAKGYQVEYVDATDKRADVRMLIASLAGQGANEIHYADVADNWLQRRVKESCGIHQIATVEYETPAFMISMVEADRFFKTRKSYFHNDFYIWQRKTKGILLDAAGDPEGGQWSYDSDNRQKFPKGGKQPVLPWSKHDQYVEEAEVYTEKFFSSNPGSAKNFGYPVTFEDADAWLDNFLQTRLRSFGPYEDAMVKENNFLFHSVLSPLVNIGLLEPGTIIKKTLDYAQKNKIPLNSLEGFIRQIIGWREFIRAVYMREGSKQRTKNYMGFKRKIPNSFWTATTGIPPVDTVIRDVLETGYTHHINRLMVLGNFMLLCEFDPDDVYRWFMEMFVDAYDWVMVPNTYGMTQFADGGLMTTKPYISGSNYLMKMGNWEKGEWQLIWDGLFWRFMDVHRPLIGKNPRLAMLLKTFEKMDRAKRTRLITAAEDFLGALN